jgi:hypothetical protein
VAIKTVRDQFDVFELCSFRKYFLANIIEFPALHLRDKSDPRQTTATTALTRTFQEKNQQTTVTEIKSGCAF